MYTNDDLSDAVQKGIFTQESVAEFRAQLASSRNTPSVDEESFKLITGFNDIFVVIASVLLLFSSSWILRSVDHALASLAFPFLAWGLAEYFVLRRKMALPAIVLLVCFIWGVFAFSLQLNQPLSKTSFIIATAATGIAAYLHWLRFKVPITIAAGTAATIGFFIASFLTLFPSLLDWFWVVIFLGGVVVFVLAMYWDASDRDRVTYRSDVAFWLHLLSAPLLIHPVFLALGILHGNESVSNMVIVILLYALTSFISVVVDRRAFMVSSLIYVIYAFSSLLKAYGVVGYSFAATGVFIGAALLLMSVFWYKIRANLVGLLPSFVREYLPKVNGV